ncbi:hypothetical protein [Pseudoclavibacter helvolus]|uniref:hypothetical protein n=1 Tax=Pseudoclavibacter helvolus TaxID=255205 RepID=UPI003C78FD68
MNHVLTTHSTTDPSTLLVTITPTSTSTPTGKPSLLHRVELRVALWLLLRSARRQAANVGHAEQHRRRHNDAERARREQDALRAWCTRCMHH